MAASVVIVRDVEHSSNLSGGREIFIPSRYLYGVVPHALLDAYQFWQDESVAPAGSLAPVVGYKKLRGYPVEAQTESIIVVEIRPIANWLDFDQKSSKAARNMMEATGFPGASISISRVSKAHAESVFCRTQKLAAAIEELQMLKCESVPKKQGSAVNQKKDEDEDEDFEEDAEEDEAKKFKVGTKVEVDLRGNKRQWSNGVVTEVDEEGNYAVKMDDSSVGTITGLRDEVQLRGTAKRQRDGDGVWHWKDMSDSEDEDWKIRYRRPLDCPV
jgi:hypothetical protein